MFLLFIFFSPPQAHERAIAELIQRLPPEPDVSNGEALRIRIRLPNGENIERRFLPSNTIQV